MRVLGHQPITGLHFVYYRYDVYTATLKADVARAVTGQLADAIGDFTCLVFLFGGICETASCPDATCPVRELAIRQLAYPRVVQLPRARQDELVCAGCSVGVRRLSLPASRNDEPGPRRRLPVAVGSPGQSRHQVPQRRRRRRPCSLAARDHEPSSRPPTSDARLLGRDAQAGTGRARQHHNLGGRGRRLAPRRRHEQSRRRPV